MKKVFFLWLVISLLSTKIISQPPAQGPPAPPLPGVTNSEFPLFLVINTVRTTIQQTLQKVNDTIAASASSTGVEAHVSFNDKVFKPGMTASTYNDRPNENMIRFAIMINYTVSNIHYHGIPYFSRNISQTIDLSIRCKNWFVPPGTIVINTKVEQPYLDDASFAEEALNFFIGHTLTDLVDSKLRNALPGAMSTATAIPNSNCSCLGVDPGVKPDYTDGTVLYAYKKGFKMPVETVLNKNAIITLKTLKRLPAKANGNILYNTLENIELDFYGNQTLRSAIFNNVKENDLITLNIPPINLPKPSVNSMIVLIANIIQQSNFQKDTRFVVYNKNQNWGNGDQRIIIQKSYWTQPQRLPNGGMSKPFQSWVDAYELTVHINIPEDLKMTQPTQPKPTKNFKDIKLKRQL